MAEKPKNKRKRSGNLDTIGPGCRVLTQPITSFAKFCEVCDSIIATGKRYWFRGQANVNWLLTPSALRHKELEKRNKALDLIREFKRYSGNKLGNQAPQPREKLKWIQIAQHYGIPTRLLDWTEINTVALYFSCCDQPDRDGAVFMLNPVDLNREADPKRARILDPDDEDIINSYLDLDGKQDSKGRKTIAISPIWNSDRIQQQQGMFTVQGSQDFSLTNDPDDPKVPSLVCLRIKKHKKQSILRELDRAGWHEMSIFPDLEHMCQYLRWRNDL